MKKEELLQAMLVKEPLSFSMGIPVSGSTSCNYCEQTKQEERTPVTQTEREKQKEILFTIARQTGKDNMFRAWLEWIKTPQGIREMFIAMENQLYRLEELYTAVSLLDRLDDFEEPFSSQTFPGVDQTVARRRVSEALDQIEESRWDYEVEGYYDETREREKRK